MAAVVILVGTSLYGIAAPSVAGPYGYHNGEYVVRARHLLRDGAFVPVQTYGWRMYPRGHRYLDHPVLTTWLVALMMAVLGNHEYALRAAALLAYLASFILLARLVYRRYGPWQAALASWVYVLLPVNVWYGTLVDHGLPGIACALGFFICYFDWLDTARWRRGALALVCWALVAGFDWTPCWAALPIGLYLLRRAIRERGRHLAFLMLYVGAVLLPVAIHVCLILAFGQKSAILATAHQRATAPDYSTFVTVLLEIWRPMFGTPILGILGVWLLLLIVRGSRGTLRARDLVGPAFLFSAIAQAHAFKEEALMYHYRLVNCAVPVALALVDLAEEALHFTGAHLGARAQRWIGIAMGGATALLLSIAAGSALRESRAIGGRPGNSPTSTDNLTRIAFAERVLLETRPGDLLFLSTSMDYEGTTSVMPMAFDLDRDLKEGSLGELETTATQSECAAALAALNRLSPDDRKAFLRLAANHPLFAVGDYALIDLRSWRPSVAAESALPPDGLSLWRRYLVGPYPRLVRQNDSARATALTAEIESSSH
jgi:hypothetical protein